MQTAVGVAAFLAALGMFSLWYVPSRRRARAAVRAALSDPDVGVRIAALQMVARQGMEPYLDTLYWRATVEPDARASQLLRAMINYDPTLIGS